MTSRGHLHAVPDVDSPPDSESIPRPRRSDGHVLGNHGNRSPAETRRLVCAKFAATLKKAFGDEAEDLHRWTLAGIPADEQDWATEALGGCDVRTLRRIVSDLRAERARVRLDEMLREAGQADPDEELMPEELLRVTDLCDGKRPGGRVIIKQAHWDKLRTYPNRYQAWLHESAPGGIVEGWSKSAFYDAIGDLHPAAKTGEASGTHATPKEGRAKRMSSQQLHPPRATATRVNEEWSTDVYDLKTDLDIDYDLRDILQEIGVDLRGLTEEELGELKLSVIPSVDEASGYLVHGALVLGDPSADITAAHHALACLGHEMPDGTRVFGAPLRLGSDQGSQFMSVEFRTKIRYVGTNSKPHASYTPTGDGFVERLQKDIGVNARLNAGHHSGPWQRNGKKRQNDGDRSALSAVLARLEEWFNYRRFIHVPRTGRHAGQTAAAKYSQMVAAGDVVRLAIEDRNLARLAMPADERLRSTEPTKGVNYSGDGIYYQSLRLAQYGATRVMVRILPGRQDIAYVHTPDWEFAALVYRVDCLPDIEAQAITEYNGRQKAHMQAANQRYRAWRRSGDTADRNIATGSPTPTPGMSVEVTYTGDEDSAAGSDATQPVEQPVEQPDATPDATPDAWRRAAQAAPKPTERHRAERPASAPSPTTGSAPNNEQPAGAGSTEAMPETSPATPDTPSASTAEHDENAQPPKAATPPAPDDDLTELAALMRRKRERSQQTTSDPQPHADPHDHGDST